MLHHTTFEYLKPTEEQLATMAKSRAMFADFTTALDVLLPDGPDKEYVLRTLRETAMWTNVCITREADGAPRS